MKRWKLAPSVSTAISLLDAISRNCAAAESGRSTKIGLCAAALVIAMYLGIQLLWYANPLVLTAFLGVLFGLAVAAGVDKLEGFRIPRAAGAGMIVVTFFAFLFGIGAWLTPIIREQSIELR